VVLVSVVPRPSLYPYEGSRSRRTSTVQYRGRLGTRFKGYCTDKICALSEFLKGGLGNRISMNIETSSTKTLYDYNYR